MMNASYADDCAEFTKLMREKLGDKAKKYDSIDVNFIVNMIRDELDEFDAAQEQKVGSKYLTMSIDAIIDAIYYIYQHLTAVGINVNQISGSPNVSFFEAIRRRECPSSAHFSRCDCCLCFRHSNLEEFICHVTPKLDIRGYVKYVRDCCQALEQKEKAFSNTKKDEKQNVLATKNNETQNVLATKNNETQNVSNDDETQKTLIHIANTLLHLANVLLHDTTAFDTIWKLVHKANMTKFSGDGYLKPDGKWQKPSNFVPPDDEIEKYLIDNKLVKLINDKST